MTSCYEILMAAVVNLVQLLFAGFSIKAVPFQNAILNVKELGGKCSLLFVRILLLFVFFDLWVNGK